MMRWTNPIEPIGPNFICFSLDFSFMIGPFQVSYYIGDRSLVMVCRLYFQLGTICTSWSCLCCRFTMVFAKHVESGSFSLVWGSSWKFNWPRFFFVGAGSLIRLVGRLKSIVVGLRSNPKPYMIYVDSITIGSYNKTKTKICRRQNWCYMVTARPNSKFLKVC